MTRVCNVGIRKRHYPDREILQFASHATNKAQCKGETELKP